MAEKLVQLFSKETAAQDKVNIIADLFKSLFAYVAEVMGLEAAE